MFRVARTFVRDDGLAEDVVQETWIGLRRRVHKTAAGTKVLVRMDARGISDSELDQGLRRSTLEELADWVQWADRAVSF